MINSASFYLAAADRRLQKSKAGQLLKQFFHLMLILGGKTRFVRGGFTLIEVIAVLFVISLGLLGVLSLIVQNIQSQSINKNTLIAYQLAQEGIELIRKNRDTHWNLSEDWDLNFPSLGGSDSYYMSYGDAYPTKISLPADTNLYQDAENFYSHDPSGAASGFTRTIYLERISAVNLLVRVTITWSDYARTRSYSLETLLYDWYD